MPSTSKKQHNFMAAIAKNPAFAKKVGIKPSIGAEFMKADKGRKFGKGGEAHEEKGEMKKDLAQDKKMIKKAIAMHDKQEHPGKKTDLSKLKGGGMARMGSKGEHPVQKQSKRGAEMIKMCGGGKAMKRYDEGGEVEFETKTGENKAIGDDVRARAMKAIAEGGVKEAPAKPKAKMKPKAKSNVMTESMSRMNPMGDTYKRGGSVSGASKRADGCAMKGKTKGRMV